MSSKNYEANGYKHNLDLLIILALVVGFISFKKWVQKQKHPSQSGLPYL